MSHFWSRWSNSQAGSISPQDADLVRRILADVEREPLIRARVNAISARFLGAPYIANPLVGSADVPEKMVVRFDGFDCVTYVETVLALAHSRRVEEFVDRLREIRYEGGAVEWRKRLHYTTEWAAYQVRHGLLKDMSVGEGSVAATKTLDFIPELPPRTVQYRYFPKQTYGYVSRWLRDSDLIYFLSVRRSLDTNHVGFIFRQGEQVHVRHARHKQGKVVEQNLADFIRVSPSPGFIINRIVKE